MVLMVKLYAETVLINGKIYSLNDNNDVFEALAIKNGKIVFLGSSKEAEEFIGDETVVIDLNGRTVLPGFIDTHIHFISVGFSLMMLDLRDVKSINELKSIVRKAVEKIEVGRWIVGRGWDQDKFIEKRYPSKLDLDEVAPNNPVFLRRVCGHIAVANSMALKISGINKSTSDPEGGKIDRDEAGEPTGILRETAMRLVWSKIPPPSIDDYIKAIELACKETLSHGITTVHFVSVTPEEIESLQIARNMGKLNVRVCLYLSAEYMNQLLILGLKRGFGDDFIKINGIKTLVDGSLGARTAALRNPYSDDPKTMGILILSRDKLKEIISKAHKHGLQIAVHAIGDRAIEFTLDVFNEVLSNYPSIDHRHRIEHASVISPELIDTMKKLNIHASVQPSFIISDFWAVDRVGVNRAKWVYPFKSMLKASLNIAGGSDCPVDPLNPLYQIYSAVTRGKYENIELYNYTQNECLNVLEAIKLFTRNAAYIGFEENVKGTLEIGKFADVVVLSDDITTIDSAKIKDVKVLTTIVNGKIVYTLDR
ncbi:MAG: amidohydrolase [Candidatus Methanomethylicia archaeon]|nr:amidohydrolase [Candidatus Methanomethylicia archaeon]